MDNKLSSLVVGGILVSLALVDCAITIARRVAVGVEKVTFYKSNVLLVNEILKLVFSSLQVCSKKRSISLRGHLRRIVLGSVQMVPVCTLYLIANLISYPALSRIPANVFASISQLKVLTTAFFTVTLLKSHLSIRRWRTLSLLMLGVIIVMLSANPSGNNEIGNWRTETDRRYFFGVFLCFFQTCLTGLGCVVLEILLKNDGKILPEADADIWDRNVQLALWSILIYFPLALHETEGDILRGWSPLVFSISGLHALGGILVALSILHASSIAKTVAVSAGLVLTSLIGGFFGDLHPSGITCAGGAIVALTIFGYRDDIELERCVREI